MNYNKTKNSIVISIVFLILLLFAENCWELEIFGEEKLLNQLYVKLVSFISIISFLIFLLVTKKKRKDIKPKFMYIWLLLYFSIIIAHFFGAVRVYGQPVNYIFTSIVWFSGVLIYFYLNRFFPSKAYAKSFFNVLIIYGLIASLLAVGVALLNLDIFTVNRIQETKRFGFTRVFGFGENAVVFTFIYYLISSIYTKRGKNIRNILFLLISGIALFLIFISRQIIFSIFCVFIVLLIKERIMKNNRAVILVALISITFAALAFSTPFFTDFITSLNYMEQFTFDANTFAIRILGIEYYYELFIKTLGTGFGWISISSFLGDSGNPFSYGTQNLYLKLVDLGIFQTLFQFGILGIIVIMLYVKKIILNAKTGSSNYEIEKRTLFYFIISRVFSLNYFFYWPLFTFFFGVLAYISERFANEDLQKFPDSSIDKIAN